MYNPVSYCCWCMYDIAHIWIDDRFPQIMIKIFFGEDLFLICMIYVPHVAGWEPYSLHDVAKKIFSWGWICALQILHSVSSITAG